MIQRYTLSLCLALVLMSTALRAQFSMEMGEHALEIGGDIISGYNYRLYQSNEKDYHKSTFLLDEARFFFKGRLGTIAQYKMEMDLADLVADIQTPATSMGVLKDAYITVEPGPLSVKVGYQKLPFSFNSMVSEVDDPFLQRPIVVSKINSRRDLGLTLSHWFPSLGLSLYGGVYSGMGEQVFAVDNTNGKPEYLGRIEFAWPARYIEQIVDMHDSPQLLFQGAASVRYKDGTVTTNDAYKLLTVNGQKTAYEFEGALMYHGLSLQTEVHSVRVVPRDSSLLFSQGKYYANYVASGLLVELNYYSRMLHSVVAVRYDELNPSDLTYGDTQRSLSFAWTYFINQNYLCIKAQYEHHLPLDFPSGFIWKDDELRLAIQMIIH